MKIQNSKQGFTLIELLITLAIFGLFVITVTSVAISVISAQRKAFGTQNVQESGRFVSELLTKEIRTSIVNSVAAGNKVLDIDTFTENVVYFFDENRHQLLRNGYEISPENVTLDGFFIVNGLPDNPVVTFIADLTSEVPKAAEQSKIYVQSTITPRK